MRYFGVSVQRSGFTEISCGQHTSATPVPPGGSATFSCDGSNRGLVNHFFG